nr:Chain C, ALA-THR-GLU-ILE-ARG-GLU-LEU-LEU-VAL [uncultured virus]7EMC_F Chain F, ALA-THR-GLU-ILE-ARG-GLU-LEU-LEU-VAL [uncultured virus]7EMC_I Chain I, ALA-THR-GLU-ILE-ARG-GLU-LEU-LEU-VAL [uncultured virus]
ATEIRELLV